MEEKSITPRTDTTRTSQRGFLLTVIGLLATLILSSLCVIALLLSAQAESTVAPHRTIPGQTIGPIEKKDTEPLSQGEEIGTDMTGDRELNEASQGSQRIVPYSQSSAGDNRVISYHPRREGEHRIILYSSQGVTSTKTTSAIPHFSHRIIIYDGSQ